MSDLLCENHRLDMGLSDHRRIEATFSLADDDQTAARLLSALTGLTKQTSTLPPAGQVELPSAAELELEPAMPPRDAFFAPKETVSVGHAAGRICAEQITPYPPGIPVIIPGERITAGLLDYLRSGVSAGMQLPDAADSALDKIRVVRRHRPGYPAPGQTRCSRPAAGRPAPPTDRIGSTNLTRLPARYPRHILPMTCTGAGRGSGHERFDGVCLRGVHLGCGLPKREMPIQRTAEILGTDA